MNDEHAREVLASGDRGARGSLVLLVLGVVSLIFALGFAIATYLKRGIAVGLRPDDFEQVISHNPDRTAYLEASLEAYAEGIRMNDDRIYRTASSFTITLWLFIGGVVLATLGAIGLIGEVIH